MLATGSDVAALFLPARFLIGIVSRLIYGSETVVGSGVLAHTLDASPIERRAVFSIAIGLAYCVFIAINRPGSTIGLSASALCGVVVFGLVESGLRAGQARQYWNSGHLKASISYRRTMFLAGAIALVVSVPTAISGTSLSIFWVPSSWVSWIHELLNHDWALARAAIGGVALIASAVAIVAEINAPGETKSEKRTISSVALILVAFVLSAISATVLAWKGFNLSFGPFLLGMLEAIESDYQYVFGFCEPLIKEQLKLFKAWFGWETALQPHWRHVFVLLWLFFSKYARAVSPLHGTSTVVFHLVWGGVVAAVVGVACGTVALDSRAMFHWPFTGFFAFLAGDRVWRATHFELVGLERRGGWFARFGSEGLMIVGATVASAYFGTSVARMESFPLAPTLPSPGLAYLASAFLILAFCNLLVGASFAGRGYDFPARFVRLGIDMLLVVLSATLVALLGFAGL